MEGVPHVDNQIILSIRQVVPRLIPMGSNGFLCEPAVRTREMEAGVRRSNAKDTSHMSETPPARQAMTILLRAATHPVEERTP